MIVLLDTSDDLAEAGQELGMEVGQLITPLSRFRNRGGRFAIDNGAWAGLDTASYVSLLEREVPNRERCLFRGRTRRRRLSAPHLGGLRVLGAPPGWLAFGPGGAGWAGRPTNSVESHRRPVHRWDYGMEDVDGR